ncbi:MAG: hypothetical protein Q8R91_10955 [Candidatus Omnitrophota bacterium]|nr:hypothetical protein [Candidatus Omnitrophota bacterium]
MEELEGQDFLVALILGEDALELDEWEAMALHQEEGPWPRHSTR